MNPELLLAHFDRISDAPDAIPRLRRFILDLAVRGKLVEQDPKDEPASELLRRIQSGKTRLLKEGKIRAHGPQLEISANDIDFPLPKNWVATRIGDLLTVIRGASPRPKGDPKYFSAVRTPYHWIKISDIRKHSRDRVLCDTDEFLTKAGMEKSVLLPKGTLVVTNSATIGVPIFLGFEGGCIHDGYLAFPYFPTSELSKDFFFVLFQTLQSYASKKARGMAQLNLNTELVREFPLGLPPLSEQRRIVAKVDELMALCGHLEATQRERETRKDRLAAACHHYFNNGATTESFRRDANFYLGQLPRLASRPDQIAVLRRSILSLAVHGHLIPQDPIDEPASELLKRIRSEKALLAKHGKIRLPKPLSAIPADIAPFELPSGWLWVRFGEIIEDADAGWSPKSENFPRSGDDWGVLKVSAVSWDKFLPEENKQLLPGVAPREAAQVHAGDFLISRANTSELVAKCVVVEQEPQNLILSDKIVRLQISENCSKHFVSLVNNHASHARAYYAEEASGTSFSMKNVSREVIYGLVIPLAPQNEQRRIVAKVDELMAICDRLESQLTNVETETSRLLEAVLHHALNDSHLEIESSAVVT
jgi:type I restriction enzyme S subunit